VSPGKPLAGDPLPDFVAPELATLVDRAPSGSDWLHELKFDGYRLISRIKDGTARLMTRRGLDWTRSFRSIAHDLEKLLVRTSTLDGEAVVLLAGCERGHTQPVDENTVGRPRRA
jgi:bifunctional non-homologous end joining protein LigD